MRVFGGGEGVHTHKTVSIRTARLLRFKQKSQCQKEGKCVKEIRSKQRSIIYNMTYKFIIFVVKLLSLRNSSDDMTTIDHRSSGCFEEEN